MREKELAEAREKQKKPGDFKPPEFPVPPPPKVVQAFEVIMGIDELILSVRFPLIEFLWRVHDNIVANLTDQSNPGEPHKFMLGGGKCQARKTPLKACMFIMGRLLGVSTLLLTTGTSGRFEPRSIR